jgi:hypothetical protein
MSVLQQAKVEAKNTTRLVRRGMHACSSEPKRILERNHLVYDIAISLLLNKTSLEQFP